VERSYKRGEERLEYFDEYGLQRTQEFVNVCKLEDALVRDLKAGIGSRIYTDITRQKAAHDKDQFEVIDECPPDGITVFLVLLFCSATGYESVTYETVDGRGRGRGQLRGLRGE
jgi:hypothetical protein